MPRTAEAAKSFNQKLRATAAVLVGEREADHTYGFACECGCGGTVPLTLGEYDRRGGAWLVGHKPGRGRGNH
jgi:hypothetical protein